MRLGRAALAAVGVAVALSSVAAAGPDAARQRVAITMRALPTGTFVITPLRSGRLKADSGEVRHSVANYVPRVVVRQGQRVEVYKPVIWVLEGKRGTLSIREPANEWMDAGAAEIGVGTWTVVHGTGQYGGLAGGGRSAHVGDGSGPACWCARQEGFLTIP
jgi:hypothetical protein